MPLTLPPETTRLAPRRTLVPQALLSSELATVALCVWVQARLLAEGVFPWAVAVAAAAVSLFAFGVDWSARTRFPAVPRLLGLVLIAAIVGLTGGHAGWAKVGAGVCCLALALAVMRRLLVAAARRLPLTSADGYRGAVLQLVAAWALHPYIVSGLVGSGDAYHYGLMVADMIGQLRAHVFPVFVGQTEFGLNGNIHTLRTAPYYVHFGAALDLATFRVLPVFAVQHLTLLVTAVVGTVGAYAALRRFRPQEPWIAAALAGLFLLSPGVLAPLYEGDMIATFMAVAMVPWLILGLAEAVEKPRAWKPWIIQACALGALWWAHPPVAFWCSAIVAGHWLVLILVPSRFGLNVLRFVAAAAVFLAVAGYVFVSVYTLKLRPAGGIDGAGYSPAIVQNLKLALPGAFLPISANSSSALSDIQLGYSLFGAILVGMAALRRSSASRFLLGSVIVLLVLVVPVPGLTAHLWDLVPTPVLTVTNVWPMQRFYLLLAALAIFLGAAGIDRVLCWGSLARPVVALGLVLALAWSARETQKYFPRAKAITSTAAAAAQSLTPEDLKLTRSSYLVFGFFPPYFSHAPIDAALESRLYDPATDSYFGSGGSPVDGAPGEAQAVELVRTAPEWILNPTFVVPPHQTLLLTFDFLGRQPKGTLQFNSPIMGREYLLPSSGESRSFGAGPDNGRLITLPNSSDQPETIQAQFIPEPAEAQDSPRVQQSFARVQYEPLGARPRMVEIESVVPYLAHVRSPRPALLETPRVFLPGYRAVVNGKTERALQTNDGLTGVFVPAGDSEVLLEYPGSALLRFTYLLSLASWLLMVGWLLVPPRWEDRINGVVRGHDLQRRALRTMRFLGLPVLGAAGLVLAGWAINQAAISARKGPIRLECELPLGVLQGAQPLLCLGKTGAADVIYLKFVDGGKIQVGDDHWGRGGALSEPFMIDWSASQRIEISTSSLLPPTAPGAPVPPVQVRWNGKVILTDPVAAYPTTAREIAVGANPVGSSTCTPTFTGTVLEVSRVPPGAP